MEKNTEKTQNSTQYSEFIEVTFLLLLTYSNVE